MKVKLYQRFNRFFERINRRRPVLIVTPYAKNIGNCAEEMYYALLKARREHKRALLLFPRPLFWKFRVDLANRVLFDIESPYAAPYDGWAGRISGCALTIVFYCLGQTYLRCRPIWQRIRRGRQAGPDAWRNNVYFVIPTIGRATLWRPDDATRFDWTVVERLAWDRQIDEDVPVRLRAEPYARAEQRRVAMGLPLDAWFVCLHVREAGFHGDWTSGAARNTAISNHLPGIKVITDAGGFVVRLGDATMTPLPQLDRVIDYARSGFKSELMDIYLMSECRFFVGVNSGPLDVIFLFQRPVVLTNLTNWSISYPKREGDLAILKHVYSRSRRRFLSLRELLTAPFDCQCVREIADDFEMVDNNAEEIRDVILEYLQRAGTPNHSERQREFNRGRHQQIRAWLERSEPFWSSDPYDDVVERYRFAPCAFAKGALGREYVEQNWDVSSRNAAEMSVGVS